MSFTISFSLVISGRKVLKAAWFNHAYCGLALGFAKDHLTCDSYVRCLLCKQDVKVASRGITTFFEHCRGMRHHKLDCLVRLRRGLALRKRDGTLMSEAEADACAGMLSGESVPVVEKCPSVSIYEALQTEAAGDSVWGNQQGLDDVDQTESVRLFVCLVIDAIYRDCDLLVCGTCETCWLRLTVNILCYSERLVESPTLWLVRLLCLGLCVMCALPVNSCYMFLCLLVLCAMILFW